jgi:hypothetical protein
VFKTTKTRDMGKLISDDGVSSKEPQLLVDFIYGFRKSIQKLDKHKAGPSGGVVSGGGGGGMSQHGNEYHDPDMALQSDFASHKDRHKSGGGDALQFQICWMLSQELKFARIAVEVILVLEEG